MTQVQNTELKTLVNIITAHAAYYGRELTQEELIDCKKTISFLQKEIEARKKLLDPSYNRILQLSQGVSSPDMNSYK